MNATNNDPSAIGVYDDLEKAEQAIDELRHAGFQSDEIGIIGHVAGADKVPSPPEMHAPEENAATGLIRGGIIGAVVGALVILVIPGLGRVAGMGDWFDLLGGAVLGAIVSGVLVAFGSFVFARSQTRLYVAELEKGNFIVSVKNPARKDEAASVLRRQGTHVEKDAG